MDADEWLVERLIEFTPKVFHLEAYQTDIKSDRYPCIVYGSADSVPAEELGVNPGYFTTTYILNIIGKRSQEVRNIANTIKEAVNTEDYQDLVYSGSCGRFTWASVTADTEENLFASEQQEKGYKIVSILFTVQHWSENGV